MKEIGKLKEKLTEKKREVLIAALMCLGAFLILISGINPTSKNDTNNYIDAEFYTDHLEEKIAEICKSINGIDDAKILLTLDCSSEYVYGDSSSDYIILKNDGNEEAVMLREIYPRVRGIAVVCTGGDLPRIQETVISLLSAAIGIPSSKIMVAGM